MRSTQAPLTHAYLYRLRRLCSKPRSYANELPAPDNRSLTSEFSMKSSSQSQIWMTNSAQLSDTTRTRTPFQSCATLLQQRNSELFAYGRQFSLLHSWANWCPRIPLTNRPPFS